MLNARNALAHRMKIDHLVMHLCQTLALEKQIQPIHKNRYLPFSFNLSYQNMNQLIESFLYRFYRLLFAPCVFYCLFSFSPTKFLFCSSSCRSWGGSACVIRLFVYLIAVGGYVLMWENKCHKYDERKSTKGKAVKECNVNGIEGTSFKWYWEGG